MSRLSRRTLVAALALSPIACAGRKKDGDEFEGIGLDGASSEPPTGTVASIEPGDLVAITARGRWLFDAERSLGTAWNDGLARIVADPGKEGVLPLVDVDPGGRSSQVVFVRWPPSKEPRADLDPDLAQRWVLVSLLLWPDRVMDIELLGEERPDEIVRARIDALVAAAKETQKRAPRRGFHMFDVIEAERGAPPDEPAPAKAAPGKTAAGKRKKEPPRRIRIYALADDDAGPDLEIVVHVPADRKERAAVVSSAVIHERGSLGADPVVVAAPEPQPCTVARAMIAGADLRVRASTGLFTVSAKDGRITRVSPAPSAPDTPAAAG